MKDDFTKEYFKKFDYQYKRIYTNLSQNINRKAVCEAVRKSHFGKKTKIIDFLTSIQSLGPAITNITLGDLIPIILSGWQVRPSRSKKAILDRKLAEQKILENSYEYCQSHSSP